jgi:hypothetical protein
MLTSKKQPAPNPQGVNMPFLRCAKQKNQGKGHLNALKQKNLTANIT